MAVVHEPAASVAVSVHMDIWVILIWLAEWLLAFGFSRFAAWKASHSGEDAWASWALLPAYEAAIVFKKLALVMWLVLAQGRPPDFSSEASSAGFAVVIAGIITALSLYNFAYVTVLYALCARSAGTVTFYRAIGTTFVLALIVGAIVFFESAGGFNLYIVQYNAEHNTTIPLWPSFGGEGPSRLTTSVPGYDQLLQFGYLSLYSTICAMAFWLGLAAAILGVIGMLLISVKLCPPPRQVGLVATLFAMFVIMQFGSYFSNLVCVNNALGFSPLILFGVMEMPMRYYIMLLDSRVRHAPHTPTRPHYPLPVLTPFLCVLKFWSSLSLTGTNATSALDMLENEMVRQIALEIRSSHNELAPNRASQLPTHIHFTRSKDLTNPSPILVNLTVLF